MESLEELLSLQTGVISRRQALARGLVDHDIARRLRRREWARVHDGVYVDHTGGPTWLQRAWAAVLFSWPAALSHESALRAGDGPGRRGTDGSRIHVVVGRHRKLVAPKGVVVHRRTSFEQHVLWNRSPPRVRYEQAVLEVAAHACDELDAVAVLARAVQSGGTTSARLQDALVQRPRLARRQWLAGVLHDVAEGTCSVLEFGYLRLVERAHGLPPADRQTAERGRTGRVYRDAAYAEPVLVELDGRLDHGTTEAWDRDHDRDLLALAGGRVTARLSWGQVFRRPCWTAAQVERLLLDRGWTGKAVRCGPDCRLPG